jgi:hypothetical protein
MAIDFFHDIRCKGDKRDIYSDVLRIAKERTLLLDTESLTVGDTLYFGSKKYSEKVELVEAIISGYEVTTTFFCYDTSNGKVDTASYPIFVDKEGRNYRWEDISTDIYPDKGDAFLVVNGINLNK